MEIGQFGSWLSSWASGIALIVLCVAVHVTTLLAIHHRIGVRLKPAVAGWTSTTRMPLIMGFIILLLTLLHGLEALVWASAYVAVGAIPKLHGAILFSLGAMTTYGNSDLDLVEHWRLLGALEALNGMLLFGMTTAFVFSYFQRIWLEQPP